MADLVLHRFFHGLEEAVPFTAVLKHLAQQQPDWINEVVTLRGAHSCFGRLAGKTYVREDEQPNPAGYARVFDHDWPECDQVYQDAPSTRAINCIRNKFGLQVSSELLRYEIKTDAAGETRADTYLGALPQRDVVFVHYAEDRADGQNLCHRTANRLCQLVLDYGLTPIIWDWDHRSPLPDDRRIFGLAGDDELWLGQGAADAQTLAALLSRGRLNVCINGGPLKVALAVGVPLLAVWTKQHPVHHVDHSPDSCLHLLPQEHWTYARGVVEPYFTQHYRQVIYKDLESALLSQAAIHLRRPAGLPPKRHPQRFLVGIPTLRRYDLLDRCINSILRGTALPERILVIDNGRNYQSSHSIVEVIRPSHNLGVPASWNLLHKLADPVPLVISNDDLCFGKHVLEELICCDAPMALAAEFSCFRLSHEVWKKVGPFDETFFPGYFEDNDYLHRLRMAGVPVISVQHDGVTHHGSATVRSFDSWESTAFGFQFQRGRIYYLQKWGGPPGQEAYARPFNESDHPARTIERAREALYHQACVTASDISEHCPILYDLARECEHVTELGGNHGVSTAALLHAQPLRLVCYINLPNQHTKALQTVAGRTELILKTHGVLTEPIEPTDLLFIDTYHSYRQLRRELELHGPLTRRFIVLHDTATFGERGQDGGKGLWPAVEEFISGGEFRIREHRTNCHGLTILERAVPAPSLPEPGKGLRELRLDIGSGGKAADYLGEGWLGVDLFTENADIRAAMWSLPFKDDSVEEIFSSHALEHVAKHEVMPTLREWHRVLKSGGKLTLRVPDLAWCCRQWLDHQTTGWDLDVIFGSQMHPGEFHQTGFTPDILRDYLVSAGFTITKFEELATHSQKTLSFDAHK